MLQQCHTWLNLSVCPIRAYAQPELHTQTHKCREDVQCMAYMAPYMLATGDYGGRICVWNIFTGERRCTLTHEAPEYQRGVEQLLFLRLPEPHASPILLSCGGIDHKIMHSNAALQSSSCS